MDDDRTALKRQLDGLQKLGREAEHIMRQDWDRLFCDADGTCECERCVRNVRLVNVLRKISRGRV